MASDRNRPPPGLARDTTHFVAPVMVSLAVMLVAGAFSIELLSTLRAWVGGESLYSKGQKDATYYLARYTVTGSQADYDRYQRAIALPLGDRQARLALQHHPIDARAARQGMLQGGNDPADIPSAILLFRLFGNIGPVRDAIDVWTQGDACMLRLQALGDRIHAAGPAALAPAQRAAALSQLNLLDQEVTPLEMRFSYALGWLARTTRTLLVVALAGSALVIGLLCVRVTRARVGERLARERSLAHQNRILNLIASGAELDRVFATLALYLEEEYPGTLCALVAQDLNGPGYSLVVAPSMPPGFDRALAGAGQEPDPDVCNGQLPDGRVVVVPDLATSAVAAPLRTYAAAAGLQSVRAWPVHGTHGQLLGALSLFTRRGTPLSAPDARMIGVCTDLAGVAVESRRAADRIRHLAHHDELTGLPNRLLFNYQLPQAIARAQRTGAQVGVLFVDLDRFKVINDTLGHAAGDAVLRQIAAHLLECLRGSDVLARVGGDEFTVLVEQFAGPQELAALAQRLLAAMSGPITLDGLEYRLSGSVGIAVHPRDGSDGTALLKRADIAMYRAKESGRNTYQFYSNEIDPHSIERLALENELRRAVARRELEVHYQPKIDIRTGRIAGAEALVRWTHPQRGPVAPAQIIGVAEELGVISAIGGLVLEKVCTDLRRWQAQGLPPTRVAINLSAQQFADTRLLEDLERVLRQTGCDPRLLEFEITESVVMTSPDQALRTLGQIKAHGITLAIDDFGTGHSSLAYLKRFPVDTVKIDHTFIRDLAADPDDLAITKAIIVLGHALGLKVVAEGVESAAQLEILRRNRCDEFQGFLFSAAVPAGEFGALMRLEAAGPPARTAAAPPAA
ncbi:MAG TPA: EAL domain-containing protein [Steroidobacteraceae bacterium]|nr:EAL domain-containing protein [Steroidobacteraceae bacterium]